jgi:hypothetical protein
MRSRDPELNSNWGTICTPVEMMAVDGKKRRISAANAEGILRLIQSVPSPKAEPFKAWLARVGSQRISSIKTSAAKPTRVLRRLFFFKPSVPKYFSRF